MPATPVIAVFDVGKTNKKLFLFDQDYQVVYEESEQFDEIKDEDGFPCENLAHLTQWVQTSFQKLMAMEDFQVEAVNFSAYGASFVHIDEEGRTVAPLYNYLKPFPEELLQEFYATYGGKVAFSIRTASPVLGNLNSGMQLYWLKHKKPELFSRIEYSLHLPQYLSYLATNYCYTDITSIGCHTNLWDFQRNDYHPWVFKEKIYAKFAPIYKCSDAIEVFASQDRSIAVGIGLHDSSAALIPYLTTFSEPFILLSTGTWCISINPFNNTPLTEEELAKDSLCYLTYLRNPVKASRLFAGSEHEAAVKKIAARFQVAGDFFKSVNYDAAIIERLTQKDEQQGFAARKPAFTGGTQPSCFSLRNLEAFASPEDAYHRLMMDITEQQVASTRLVLAGSPVQSLFVDGGFSKNPIYMNLLSTSFLGVQVHAASVAQATSLGAALAIHHHWNHKPIPQNLIGLKRYSREHREMI